MNPNIVSGPVKIMVGATDGAGKEWALVGYADMVEVSPEPLEEEFYVGSTEYKMSMPQTMSVSFRMRPDAYGNLGTVIMGREASAVHRLLSKHFPKDKQWLN